MLRLKSAALSGRATHMISLEAVGRIQQTFSKASYVVGEKIPVRFNRDKQLLCILRRDGMPPVSGSAGAAQRSARRSRSA